MFFRILIVPIILIAVVGALLYAIIRGVRDLVRLKAKTKKRTMIMLILSLLVVGLLVYGFTLGFTRFTVQRVEFSSADLPRSFDGYKIVMFSDAHVGNFQGSRKKYLANTIASINAENPDAICFCGDIENIEPEELTPFVGLFSSLKATDGVFSILGNHDYSLYKHNISDSQRRQLLQQTIDTERSFGWQLLLNEHATIRRGADSIVIAGEENDGSGPFPKLAQPEKTMQGVADDAFVVMLQHDPTAWRRQVLPKTKAQLTLSGHTHAAQFMIFGWSPARYIYKEYKGAYTEGGRMLYVSSGLGGVVPFRVGVPGEIVVITLKSAK